MTISARHAKLRYQALGVVFLVVVALFFAVTIASYRKVFTPTVDVTLSVASAGNQMQVGADVKARGVLVGEVKAISAVGDRAILHLALRPGKVGSLPSDVTARLLPKTLFGERYVALQIPSSPAQDHLAAGDAIAEDRSGSAVEIERVLNDLVPVLRAVQPQKLSETLAAISQALEGRGKQLGDTMAEFGAYLQRLNPSLPNLNADIASLADVSNSYADAAPDLLNALSEFTTTSRTLVQQKQTLSSLFATLTTTSVDLRNFLAVNENNLIGLVASSRPTLDVLARYAPEYPCLFRQFAAQVDDGNRVFGKGTDHPHQGDFTITVTASRGKYAPGVDTPKYNDDRGPRCYDTKGAIFPQYPPGGPIKDGSTHPLAPSDKSSHGLLSMLGGLTAPQSASTPGAAAMPQIANSAAERQLISALAAPQVGVPPKQVPGWGSLLLGPMYRGSEVALK